MTGGMKEEVALLRNGFRRQLMQPVRSSQPMSPTLSCSKALPVFGSVHSFFNEVIESAIVWGMERMGVYKQITYSLRFSLSKNSLLCWFRRNLDTLKKLGDQVHRISGFNIKPYRQNWKGDLLDIVRCHEIPPGQVRGCLSSPLP